MPPPGGGAVLRHVMLLSADVRAATRFYSEGLGLVPAAVSDRWAELRGGSGGPGLTVKAADGCGGGGVGRRRVGGLRRVPALPTPEPTCLFLSLAQTTAGYSPFLCFAVPDLQEVVTRCLALGATLDGPIHYPPAGPVAALRAPDGHMLSLHEVAGGEGLGGGVGESQAGSA